jgi:hypothetical protein
MFGGERSTCLVPSLQDRLVQRLLVEELPAQSALQITGRAVRDLLEQVSFFAKDLAQTRGGVFEYVWSHQRRVDLLEPGYPIAHLTWQAAVLDGMPWLGRPPPASRRQEADQHHDTHHNRAP